MSEEVNKRPATETIVPSTVTVRIGLGEDARDITIGTFVSGKALYAFEYMTELAMTAGVGDIMGAFSASGGDYSKLASPEFLSALVGVIPTALTKGREPLARLVGLIVTPNRRLREMDEQEVDMRAEFLKSGRGILNEATNDQLIELVMSAVQMLGTETIRKNVTSLVTSALKAQ